MSKVNIKTSAKLDAIIESIQNINKTLDSSIKALETTNDLAKQINDDLELLDAVLSHQSGDLYRTPEFTKYGMPIKVAQTLHERLKNINTGVK